MTLAYFMDDAEKVLQAANDDAATEVQAAIRHIDNAERRTNIKQHNEHRKQ